MTTPSPEELAHSTRSLNQTVLIDFDFKSPEQLVIGADPEDLSAIPTEPVKSLVAPWAVITIVAHEGEGQDVADLLYDKPPGRAPRGVLLPRRNHGILAERPNRRAEAQRGAEHRAQATGSGRRVAR